jgi:hypothetical protein
MGGDQSLVRHRVWRYLLVLNERRVSSQNAGETGVVEDQCVSVAKHVAFGRDRRKMLDPAPDVRRTKFRYCTVQLLSETPTTAVVMFVEQASTTVRYSCYQNHLPACPDVKLGCSIEQNSPSSLYAHRLPFL